MNSIEDYLGSKAHMVVIGLTDKNFLHVHPEVENGDFDLHTTFDKPGVYRGWVQFQKDGKLHTADFVFNVTEGVATDGHAHTHTHEHNMEGKEGHKH